LDDAPGTAMVLDRFAVLEAARGQHVRALHFASAAVALRGQAQTRLLASAQRALDARLDASKRVAGNASEAIARHAPPPRALIAEVLASTPARHARRAATLPGHLSPRQLEVAALVGHGYTNREIAEHLVIAEGTVATHMLHILAKLGLRSRAQVGAWAATHQLLDEPGTVALVGCSPAAAIVGAAPSSTRGHDG
jgi:non-specific serine/threonine protein kinase